MALIDIKAPSPGESIAEVQIAKWLKADGDVVHKNDPICEIESDKATLEVAATAAGVLHIQVPAQAVVPVGAVIARIDTAAKAASGAGKAVAKDNTKHEPRATQSPPTPAAQTGHASGHPSPAAHKVLAERGIAPSAVQGSGRDGRITKHDAMTATAAAVAKSPTAEPAIQIVVDNTRPHRREKMSMLRRSLARRLVAVKNETAMLTTFNEVDMSPVQALRKAKQDAFQKKFGLKLGFMSFFTRACVEALKEFPQVNALIDGDDVVFFEYADIGIAVSAPKGLMVPVIRNAQQKNSGELEQAISDLATRARDGKLSLEEMSGGTFTITNGGIFGSMLSTPILNPPQSAILGMHNIVDRPVAVNGTVEIRPIMYVALSYDHRMIDGRESVGFLKKVKELLENPSSLLTGLS